MGLQVLRDRIDKTRVVRGELWLRVRPAEPACERRDHRLDRLGRRNEPMICECAGQRHRGFDRVQPAAGAIALSSLGERPTETRLVRTGPERIGGQRHKDVDVLEARPEDKRLAVDRLSRRKFVRLGGFEDVAPAVRKHGLQPPDLIQEGRRGDASREEPEGRASVSLVRLQARS